MGKKVLVIGATGVMGQYLIPHLAEMNYQVDAIALEEQQSAWPNVTYIQANAKERAVFLQLLNRKYDGIVDFMIYTTRELSYYPLALANSTGHYIYISSFYT